MRIDPIGDPPYLEEQTLVGKFNATSQREMRLWLDPSVERWALSVSADGTPAGTTTLYHPTPISRGAFYFVEAWHDPAVGEIGLRVSSESQRGQAATMAYSDALYSGNADLNVAAHNTCADAHLQGVVDALGFWRRALTDAESEHLYNGGSGREL